MYSVADKAMNLKGGAQAAQRSLVDIYWKPPKGGWVRLNSDGACSNEVIDCGGVIRGSDEEWSRGFSKFIGASSKAKIIAISSGWRTETSGRIEAKLPK
ncbi:hypothetical protein L195_g021874 [Trifolium pratense]|uniref:Uncharacterized protein n=1 Tax=Trifolium pratense TaxID=57577 RepID=A0A2K3N6E6_TRIPR|nr:hypothetical protein L195_g021874 [Trifolium pratense]